MVLVFAALDLSGWNHSKYRVKPVCQLLSKFYHMDFKYFESHKRFFLITLWLLGLFRLRDRGLGKCWSISVWSSHFRRSNVPLSFKGKIKTLSRLNISNFQKKSIFFVLANLFRKNFPKKLRRRSFLKCKNMCFKREKNEFRV